jgi:hypothetical protein
VPASKGGYTRRNAFSCIRAPKVAIEGAAAALGVRARVDFLRTERFKAHARVRAPPYELSVGRIPP